MTDAAQLEQMMAEGKEAAAFLRSAIVQATANDRGHIGKLLALVENQITRKTIQSLKFSG